MPGGFRKFDARIDRDQARGVDATGRVLEGTVWAANDVLHAAGPWLLRARNQLRRKTSDGVSMNAFLVIHPLDYVTAECLNEYVIGPYLDPLEDVGDLDTVWVLWPPHHLTVWSRERREWLNLLFDCMNPDETAARSRHPIPLPILQDAEQYFLTRTGHIGRSPYFFRASYEEVDPESS